MVETEPVAVSCELTAMRLKLWCSLWPGLAFAAAPEVHLVALNTLKSLDGTQGTKPLVGYQVAVTSVHEWTDEMHVCMWYVMKDVATTNENRQQSAAVCSEQPSGTFPFDSPCGHYVISVAILHKESPVVNDQSLMSAVALLDLTIDCTSKNLASKKANELQQRLGNNSSLFETDELWQPFHADIWQLLVNPEVATSHIRTVSRVQRHSEPCNSHTCADYLQQLKHHARWPQRYRDVINDMQPPGSYLSFCCNYEEVRTLTYLFYKTLADTLLCCQLNLIYYTKYSPRKQAQVAYMQSGI
jgi:hypothetical protein